MEKNTKSSKTRVEASKIEAMIKTSGLIYTGQKGFVRVEKEPDADRRIYVAFTKTVARIDLSGFEMREKDGSHSPGYCAPLQGPFGKVKQQVDFSRTEDEILETVKELLTTLKALPAKDESLAKEPKEKKAKSSSPEATWSPEVVAAKEDRLTAIKASNEAKKKERAAKKHAAGPNA